LGDGEADGVAAARGCGAVHETITSEMNTPAGQRKLKPKTV
jgi:hypothetical protein